ncbi:F0F1 ATP synthase subunit B [Kangiella geojedonensis]|uniref:ATP synthase subunit b n=1 Tax=Kangiella geojedonensis TaxID=914150 RepID=A0A0F6TSB1_9GAMM|nr:F0F1 ATP synthase subunit B [Kangiella geojedonensis]AKE53189.1 ATP synthase subunit B [Kangiella geojedonensis]
MNVNLTLIINMIFFAAFVFFCMKFVWPHIMAAIEERQNKIAEGLAASERSQKDLELAQEKAAEILREAKGQSAELVDSAKKRHTEIVDSAKDDARAEADKIKSGAQAEIEQEVNRAREQLRSKVATLAVAGAEKVIERNIDEAANNDMFDKLVKDL